MHKVKRYLDRRANIHAEDNTYAAKKPIHLAAAKGYTNIVILLLSKGVNVNDTDRENRTPLYYAAWKGNLDTVKSLVGRGASIDAENMYGTKPYICCCVVR